jgi:hypothetical protein
LIYGFCPFVLFSFGHGIVCPLIYGFCPFVLFSFGHGIVCPSIYGFCPFNTMAKRQKNRQYNGQKTEEQTIQWPKDRRTDNTMAKRQKNRVLLSFGHCIVCPSTIYDY